MAPTPKKTEAVAAPGVIPTGDPAGKVPAPPKAGDTKPAKILLLLNKNPVLNEAGVKISPSAPGPQSTAKVAEIAAQAAAMWRDKAPQGLKDAKKRMKKNGPPPPPKPAPPGHVTSVKHISGLRIPGPPVLATPADIAAATAAAGPIDPKKLAKKEAKKKQAKIDRSSQQGPVCLEKHTGAIPPEMLWFESAKAADEWLGCTPNSVAKVARGLRVVVRGWSATYESEMAQDKKTRQRIKELKAKPLPTNREKPLPPLPAHLKRARKEPQPIPEPPVGMPGMPVPPTMEAPTKRKKKEKPPLTDEEKRQKEEEKRQLKLQRAQQQGPVCLEKHTGTVPPPMLWFENAKAADAYLECTSGSVAKVARGLRVVVKGWAATYESEMEGDKKTRARIKLAKQTTKNAPPHDQLFEQPPVTN